MLGPGPLPPLRGTALVTLNAHLVPLRASLPDGGTVVANPLLAGGHDFAWLALVPPVLLAAAGAAATGTADGPTALRYDLFVGRDWTRYAFNGGMLVTLGYLPFVFVVAPFATVDGARASLAVDLLRAWIQAGLVYPFAFGGLGGVVAGWYWRRTAG